MRKGTRLNLHCKKCGRAFKNAGSLNQHNENHRRADAEWRKAERGWDQDHRE